MNDRTLGRDGPTVSALGLGCMGMSEFYGPTDDEQSIATIHRALDLGITLLDTATPTAPTPTSSSSARPSPTVATRSCWPPSSASCARRASGASTTRRSTRARACDASLRRLAVDHIDLYYLHRRDPDVPIEETVGAMAELVDQGKVRYLGSQRGQRRDPARRRAVHPIAALQSEWSLWTRGIEEEIVPARARARRRDRRLQPRRARLPHRPLRLGRRPRRHRLPPLPAALPGRQSARPTSASSSA